MKKRANQKKEKITITLKKEYVSTKSAKPKFNRIVKLTQTKQAEGSKDKRTNTFVK